ncbi:DUF2062 domain-containing protein [Altererythrobacter sp. H2]|uniref:DUF2062 domain-containing protein n=1 Tax=Altererythrobacter sp. H2 TaxID=3108391 RepID=UPI002B4BFCA4|nr:DUF2062 domain-containing protein [Altererythrobacter sp. H2]WRK97064.1 DUF2062 domain-containing protein [Altererythrobacter sp. H2]
MTSPRSKTFLADLIRKHMPSREDMAQNKYLRPIAHRFLSPELWRFTRRSVPRGIALGLFAAFIIPVGQIFLAAFLALPTRANVPLSALSTFITNPFTLPFWLIVANKVGAFVLKVDAATTEVLNDVMVHGGWSMVFEAVEVAGVTAFGFIVLAVLSASIGYVLASVGWRVIVSGKWTRRLKRMEASLDARLKAGSE